MDDVKANLVLSYDTTCLWEAVLPGEGLVRRMLPAGKQPTLENLQAGIPYGLPFAEMVTVPSVDFAENLETSLHNYGIWTIDDLRTKGREVIGALQSTYGIELSRLVILAEAYKPIKPKGTKKEQIK